MHRLAHANLHRHFGPTLTRDLAVSTPAQSLLDGRIVDLTTAYATYLAQRTDEPTPRELALLRTPPDMIGFLRGLHKSREAAEHAVAFARELGPDARGQEDARLSFARTEVKLLAPLPRPNSLRDFSIFEEHCHQTSCSASESAPLRPGQSRHE